MLFGGLSIHKKILVYCDREIEMDGFAYTQKSGDFSPPSQTGRLYTNRVDTQKAYTQNRETVLQITCGGRMYTQKREGGRGGGGVTQYTKNVHLGERGGGGGPLCCVLRSGSGGALWVWVCVWVSVGHFPVFEIFGKSKFWLR